MLLTVTPKFPVSPGAAAARAASVAELLNLLASGPYVQAVRVAGSIWIPRSFCRYQPASPKPEATKLNLFIQVRQGHRKTGLVTQRAGP